MNHSSTVHSTEQALPRLAAFVELTDWPQWVAWCYQDRPEGKRTKPPVNPHTGRLARIGDRSNYGTYRQALERQLAEDLPGVGFVLTAEDPFVGIDLDSCIDEDGAVAPWAQEIVDLLDSYTEVSPSGQGLHVLARGTLPQGRRRQGNIEAYDRGRYLTVTGRQYGRAARIEERTDQLAELHRLYLAGERAPEEPAAAPATLEDLEIVDRIMASKVAGKFARLWLGDASSYPSPSEADLALASYLAFYSQDPQQVARIISLSALGHRDKWTQKRGGSTYGLETAAKAIATRAGTWDPKWGAR